MLLFIITCIYHVLSFYLYNYQFINNIVIKIRRECRQQKHLESIPIIILTAELGDDIREVAKTAGSSYFLCKPAKEGELKSVLLELIKKS